MINARWLERTYINTVTSFDGFSILSLAARLHAISSIC
jgi:hypothetical protein